MHLVLNVLEALPGAEDARTPAAGIDAVKEIVAKAPAARIVMCSALGQESLVMEALQAGAQDFIVKPFKPDAVLSTLRKVSEKEL